MLDLGCNAGYWGLKAIEAGCDFVWGIDGWPMHIEQASFVFSVEGVDPDAYRFTVGNVLELDLSAEGPFDVVLCLGLLYHVSKPMELLEAIAAANRDLLMIDTTLSTAAGSCLELRREPTLEDPRMREGLDSRGLLL